MPLQADEIRVQARLNRVREHIECENRHDLPGIMNTVAPDAQYDDVPWLEKSTGHDGVRAYYTQLLKSLPDLQVEVRHWHVAGDTIVVETTIRGTHLGAWRGLPATGRRVEFPLCGIFTFDEDERIAGERIYYDRATVLRQLGVFHEPETMFGGIVTAAMHPVTMARAVVTTLRRR
jgi:steroid delta-isomerase-like uncharacterized protein